MKLAQFYTISQIEETLAAYRASVPDAWSVSHKLDLYNAGKIAFDSDKTDTEKRAAFGTIYNALRSGWRVFRGAKGCWNADETFEALTGPCSPCGRQSVLTCAASDLSDSNSKIQACLSSIGPIKPTTRYPNVYPWMAVSKFLHFFNPRLFPIYDIAFIWGNVVDGAFRDEYRKFCRANGLHPRESTQQFNLQYTLWANSIMQNVDEECMEVFAQWFVAQAGHHHDPENALAEVNQYYAAAFEMISLGAAHRIQTKSV